MLFPPLRCTPARLTGRPCFLSQLCALTLQNSLTLLSVVCLEQSGFFRERDGSRRISQGPQRGTVKEGLFKGLPCWLSVKRSICQCRRHRLDPWSGRTPHPRGQRHPRTTTTEPVPWSPGAAATEAQAPRTSAPPQRSPTVRSSEGPAEPK